MSESFLIAHKVRGEAAFDIAIKMEVEGYPEPWWIIPTSGHRAYPFWSAPLQTILGESAISLDAIQASMPPSQPDHYPRPEPRPARQKAVAPASITLADLGL